MHKLHSPFPFEYYFPFLSSSLIKNIEKKEMDTFDKINVDSFFLRIENIIYFHQSVKYYLLYYALYISSFVSNYLYRQFLKAIFQSNGAN